MRIRQLFRFKLRTLMVLGLILSVGLGVLGRQAMEARRQRAVVASLLEQGVQVIFNDDEPSLPEWLDTDYTSRVNTLLPSETQIRESQIRDTTVFLEFKNIQILGLCLRELKKDDVEGFAGLERLTALDIGGVQINDLSPLSRLVNLEQLGLTNTQVSDLSPLSKVSNLQWLYLTKSPVSDLSPLRGLVKLKGLELIATQVSDLSPLRGLVNLELLSLHGTNIDAGQVKSLQAALPNCTIIHAP